MRRITIHVIGALIVTSGIVVYIQTQEPVVPLGLVLIGLYLLVAR